MADAIGLAVFTIIGIQKAILADVPLINAALLGTLTGVGGGVMRDLLLGHRLPLLFKQELYATSAFIGGCVYVAMFLAEISLPIVIAVSISLVLFIRLSAIRWGIKLPTFRIKRNRSLFRVYKSKSRHKEIASISQSYNSLLRESSSIRTIDHLKILLGKNQDNF